MKKLSIITLSLLVFCSSCRKEEIVNFPDYDKDWFVLEDNPSDPADHAAYLFYSEFGIPVYYNDTIGSQERVDVWGNRYIHYETLTLNYSLGGLAAASASPVISSLTYCSKECVPAAIDYLREYIMPIIPSSIHIHSFLLVENMNSLSFGTNAFKGFNTLVIGKASQLPTMSEVQKKEFNGAVLRSTLSDFVINQGRFNTELERFYKVSRDLSTTKDLYGLYTYYLSSSYVTGLPAGTPINVNTVGFLSTDPSSTYYTPKTTWMDVNMYLEAILSQTHEEFVAKYGTYELIMTKYTIIKNILEESVL
ncbi:MAG: hypothetical protein PHP30_03785 [Bacteroidales bacterium]|nr:hypothetical protein [Bacteroidales bacterium]MDD2424969.1 hypothetical protein [Bacteroidales bacterium]MDD3989202.1 hypothetical protein [Bacteroidales bacterium]